ncbi:MAG TPA: hypothetical protein VN604_02710 [Nitrospirota bacterium]|nr:hypothetical protein [Nitrospirota bacterium]
MVQKASSHIPRIRKRFFCMRWEIVFLSVILSVLVITACSDKNSPPPLLPPGLNDYTAFRDQELVTINGYNGDAMEPFISRDGATLFFNDTLNNKDLYYATFDTGTTVQFPVPISAINSPAVDGVPTMDVNKVFYYVSAKNYDPANSKYDTLYSGTWNGGTVTGSTPLNGLTLDPPLLFFDIEVSPDGNTLYLSVGAFPPGGTFPSAADIHIAVGAGGGFTLHPNSAGIMANVNTADKLEYAPAISSNGRELFFTRLYLGTGEARIYRSVRSDIGSAFGMPQLVSAITGFVEGPALSPDEKALYYHRQNPLTNRFEIYRVTRP